MTLLRVLQWNANIVGIFEFELEIHKTLRYFHQIRFIKHLQLEIKFLCVLYIIYVTVNLNCIYMKDPIIVLLNLWICV